MQQTFKISKFNVHSTNKASKVADSTYAPPSHQNNRPLRSLQLASNLFLRHAITGMFVRNVNPESDIKVDWLLGYLYLCWLKDDDGRLWKWPLHISIYAERDLFKASTASYTSRGTMAFSSHHLMKLFLLEVDVPQCFCLTTTLQKLWNPRKHIDVRRRTVLSRNFAIVQLCAMGCVAWPLRLPSFSLRCWRFLSSVGETSSELSFK